MQGLDCYAPINVKPHVGGGGGQNGQRLFLINVPLQSIVDG